MFLLLPVPAETGRLPTLTSALVLLNVVAFAVTWPMEKRRAGTVPPAHYEASARALSDILRQAEPGLRPGDAERFAVESQAMPFPSPALVELFQTVQSDPLYLSGKSRYAWASAYARFEALQRSVRSGRIGRSPLRALGFSPRGRWFPGILSHQFLHAGFWHLLFNMLFLWAAGSVLETFLGFRLLGLYLAAGVAAAASQAWWGPASDELMVGASGAIAGLMGLALFALPRAKVRLFYLYMLFVSVRHGTFHSPLWFCVPLWFLQQVFMTLMTAGMEVRVGYMAHIGGFLFGALAGLAARFLPAGALHGDHLREVNG